MTRYDPMEMNGASHGGALPLRLLRGGGASSASAAGKNLPLSSLWTDRARRLCWAGAGEESGGADWAAVSPEPEGAAWTGGGSSGTGGASARACVAGTGGKAEATGWLCAGASRSANAGGKERHAMLVTTKCV